MDDKYKPIILNGQTFYYELISFDSGPYGGLTDYVTYFYSGFEEILKVRKKYWLFGPKTTFFKKEPIFAFRLNLNIESEYYTKEEIRSKIDHQLALLARKAEIERGEIY